jgi:bla regulator protein blaR1
MTLLGWMAYAVIVSLVVAAAAWFLERGLLHLGRPTRGVWALALIAAVGLPLLAVAGTRGPAQAPTQPVIGVEVGDASPVAPSAPGISLPAEVLAGPLRYAGSALTGAAGRLLAIVPGPGPSIRAVGTLWLVGAGTLMLLLLGANLRLRRRARAWPIARIQGRPIRIAPDTGPAVVGVTQPWIILPRWTLGLDPRPLRLILLHETEHINARDTLLLALASGLVLAFFWNPGLWWILQRLGGAMEVDCDRRVLARGVSRAEYGALLVDVGSRCGGLPLPAAAMAEPSNLLERRLKQMRAPNVRHPILALGTAAVAAALLLAVACETEAPTPPTAHDDPVEVTARGVDSLGTLVEGMGRVGEITFPDPERLRLDGVREIRALDVDAPAPLVILDGVILSAPHTELGIDPERIESIEIVKGAKARELYGSRAQNGVIIITTVDAPDRPEAGRLPFTRDQRDNTP